MSALALRHSGQVRDRSTAFTPDEETSSASNRRKTEEVYSTDDGESTVSYALGASAAASAPFHPPRASAPLAAATVFSVSASSAAAAPFIPEAFAAGTPFDIVRFCDKGSAVCKAGWETLAAACAAAASAAHEKECRYITELSFVVRHAILTERPNNLATDATSFFNEDHDAAAASFACLFSELNKCNIFDSMRLMRTRGAALTAALENTLRPSPAAAAVAVAAASSSSSSDRQKNHVFSVRSGRTIRRYYEAASGNSVGRQPGCDIVISSACDPATCKLEHRHERSFVECSRLAAMLVPMPSLGLVCVIDMGRNRGIYTRSRSASLPLFHSTPSARRPLVFGITETVSIDFGGATVVFNPPAKPVESSPAECTTQ